MVVSQKVTKLLACGDINIQDRDDPVRVFDLVKDHLQSADVLVGNLEMCLSSASHTIPAKRPIAGKPAWVQSDARMVEGLEAVGFDLLTTANNVTYGHDAVIGSIRTLDEHGIGHTGSGANIEESRRPAMVTAADGTRVGLLGYSCLVYPFGHAATGTDAGVAVLRCHTAYEPHRRAHELPGAVPTVRSWPDSEELDAVIADVASLREHVDVLITYFHMGVSSQGEVAEYQRIIGRRMVDVGVDLVLGSSSHTPQAVEVFKDKPIFYGLGNFTFDWWFINQLDLRHGLLVDCDIVDGKISKVSFWPVARTRRENAQAEILSHSEGEGLEIVKTVEARSKELGTRLAREASGAVAVWP